MRRRVGTDGSGDLRSRRLAVVGRRSALAAHVGPSFPRKRESRVPAAVPGPWAPAFAGVTTVGSPSASVIPSGARDLHFVWDPDEVQIPRSARDDDATGD